MFGVKKCPVTYTVVLPSLTERLWQEDEYLLEEVEHGLQLLPLGLVRALRAQVLLGVHEAVVDDEVDVRVVGVEELDNVSQVRVVQKQPEVLRREK